MKNRNKGSSRYLAYSFNRGKNAAGPEGITLRALGTCFVTDNLQVC